MKRLHAGNGSVYLLPSVRTDPEEGWLNMDMPGPYQHLAADRPDLVEALSTTEERGYYARHEDKSIDKLRNGAARAPGVSDAFGSVLSIPASDQSVQEILLRQVFEHLSIAEARKALLEFDRVLKCGGVLRLDVPDIEGTAKALQESGDPFYIRHLFGSRKDDGAYHCMGYTRDGLRNLCAEYGFEFEAEEPSPHWYPAFTLRFRKPPALRPAWDYALKHLDLEIPAEWKCLEVGPGPNPWPRADVYVDIEPKWDPNNGKPFHVGDIQGMLNQFEDKSFDMVFAAHILEHLSEPRSAAAELSRLAKRGIIVTPHPFKEALFGFEEPDHRWLVWPPRPSDPCTLQLWRRNDWRTSALADSNYQAAIARLFRTGPARFEHDSIVLRRWFHRNEAWLDTIHYWEGELRLIAEE